MSAIAIQPATVRRWPRLRAIVWTLDIAVLLAGLIAFASIPTGAPSPAGVAPADGRVVVQQAVAGASALVVARPETLQLLVAVHKAKGWFGLRVADTAPDGIAWASTAGARGVPALSAVFGRATGATVRIRWSDGTETIATVQSDGTFLAARAGVERSVSVAILNVSGGIVRQVAGP